MPAWLPWTTIRTEALNALAKTGFAVAAFPEYRRQADLQVPGLGNLMMPLESGTPDPRQATPEAGEPEFRLVLVSDRVLLGFASKLRAVGGKAEDPEFLEYVVRRGCRGHRNFRDAQGRAIPSQLESGPTGEVLLSRSTYNSYELSGVVAALAMVIMRRPACLER